MKLSDKILYCRKKAGLSQEALADMIGVSRQAVSKWETGDAVPEIGKLLLLAKAFQVTTDWLLSEEEPENAAPEQDFTLPREEDRRESGNWADSIPGVIGRLIRRYGWLYGVYAALGGLGITLVGILARVLSRQVVSFDPFGTGAGGEIWYDGAGNVISNPFGSQTSIMVDSPITTMGTVIMWLGIVVTIAGAALAIYLKSRAGDSE